MGAEDGLHRVKVAWMTPEQARLVQMAAAYLALAFRGDATGANTLFEDLKAEPRLPDAFVLVSLLAADTWGKVTGEAPDQAFDRLHPPAPTHAELVRRDPAMRLARAVRDGDEVGIASASSQLDRAQALVSALDLAMATVDLVEEVSGKPAQEWCELWAGGAAAGAGIGD